MVKTLLVLGADPNFEVPPLPGEMETSRTGSTPWARTLLVLHDLKIESYTDLPKRWKDILNLMIAHRADPTRLSSELRLYFTKKRIKELRVGPPKGWGNRIRGILQRLGFC